MNQVWLLLGAESQTGLSSWAEFSDSFPFTQLQLFLLAGSAILAIALMLLTLTKWGHARPVWKCVFLSIGAHVLLVVYAYGTHLIFKVPGAAQQGKPVKINLLLAAENAGEETSNQAETGVDDEPWNVLGKLTPSPSMAEVSSPLTDLEPPKVEAPQSLKTSFQPTPSELVSEKFSAQLDAPELEIPPRPNEMVSRQLPELSAGNETPRLPASKPAAELKGLDSAIDAESPTVPLPGLPTDLVDGTSSIAASDVIDTEPNRSESETLDDPLDDPDRLAANPDLPVIDQGNDEADATAVESMATAEAANAVDGSVDNPINEIESSDAEGTVEATSSPESDRAIAIKTNSSSVPVIQASQSQAPRRIGDGEKMPTLYAARATDSKLKIAQQRGGSEATEAAVELALQWLATRQSEDGRWNPRENEGGVERMVLGHDRRGAGINADTGITALAVLAFLAHGHTHLEGEYRETVQHGLEFLVRNQQMTGDLAGDATFFARTYCHSMSLLAICESLAITGDQRLKPAAQRGVDFTLRMQNPVDGGWRYQYGDAGDMSQFGWIVLALHSAELGGVQVPEGTRMKMKNFLESCTRGRHQGLASYRPREEITHSMTAEAFVCRNFLTADVDPATKREAADKLLTELPGRRQTNLYYWYYGTLAMYNAGGEYWEQWNRALTRVLLEQQHKKGKLAGSWAPNGVWAGYGGRVYSTAMSTLCLEVYYRYLPMFEVAELENQSSPRSATRTPVKKELDERLR